MKIKSYTVIFKSEPEGGYTVIVPSLPGCVTYGKTLEEAKAMAEDAIIGYIASLKEHKEQIPADDSVYLSSISIKEGTRTFPHV